MSNVTIDLMEYASNFEAEKAWLRNTTIPPIPVFPPFFTDTYVKATSYYDANTVPPNAADPGKLLTANQNPNGWQSNAATNQRFHIDLGVARFIEKVYYENGHDTAANTTRGAKNFTLWGSNDPSAFAELTYGTDTGWTQLTTSISQFAKHAAEYHNNSDPQYFDVTASIPYRYYAFKFADNWGDASYMAVRRLTLMSRPRFSLGPDDIYTMSLLHFYGVDFQVDRLRDECGRFWEFNGDTKIRHTVGSRVGGAAIAGDGTGDCLYADGRPDFGFGTGDYTIDFWIWASSFDTASKEWCDFRPAVNGYYPCIYTTTGRVVRLYMNSADVISGTTVMVDKTWNHVALVRQSGETKLFLNGVQEGSTWTDANNYPTPITLALVDARRPVLLARGMDTNICTPGYIAEFRVSKGIARWFDTFTPPNEPYQGLVISSEASIVNEGSYALKLVAQAGTVRTDNVVNEIYGPAVARHFDTPLDLTACKFIKFDLRSNRSGSNIKITFNGSGYSWDFIPNVTQADTWGTFTYAFPGMKKLKRIRSIQISVINADSATTFYLDNLYGTTGTDLSLDLMEYPSHSDILKAWSPNSDRKFDHFTKALLHFEVADQGTVFTDETGKIWTVGGNAITSTEQAKFGTSSLKLDGTGDYVLGNNGVDFIFGATLDWTIECWVYSSDFNQDRAIIDFRQSSFSSQYPFIHLLANKIRFYQNNDLRITGHTFVANSEWHHIAVARCRNLTRLFLDGVLQGTPWSDTVNWGVGANRPAIGVDGVGMVNGFAGYIDEVRISKGIARYVTNFRPPAKPFYSNDIPKVERGIDGPDDSYTKLLMHFEGEHLDGFYKAETGQTVQFFYDARLSTLKKKFGRSSLHLYPYANIEIQDSADFVLGTDNFCIDFWLCMTTNPANFYNKYFYFQGNESAGHYFNLKYSQAGGVLQFYANCRNNYTWIINGHNAIINLTPHKWYHIAYTRDGSTFRWFVDGVQVGSNYTSSASIPDYATPLWIGKGWDGTHYLDGYIDEYRLSVGTYRWNANFTPPSAPYAPPSPIVNEGSAALRLVATTDTLDENLTRNLLVEGGTITTANGRTIHTFKQDDWLKIPPGISLNADLLVVAGGGGGGGYSGGGGGAGGVVQLSTILNPGEYFVQVGAGGMGASNSQGAQGADGRPSFIAGDKEHLPVATFVRAYIAYAYGGGGGGGGGLSSSVGRTGGSGGGGGQTKAGGAGTPGQGYNGGLAGSGVFPYNAGGGGGAGGPGKTSANTWAGDGGPGIASSISGEEVYYGGGGGGGGYNFSPDGIGGIGGGGSAGGQGGNPYSGLPFTGGGGGANVDNLAMRAGNGGSGIVIISYPTIDLKLDIAGRSNFNFKLRATRTGANLRVSLPVNIGGKKTFNGSRVVLTFTEDGIFYPPNGGEVDVLVVAGGGGGGTANGGGGGGGGVIYATGHTVTSQPYAITVGKGGLPGTGQEDQKGSDGGNSVFDTLTAIGGGGGGCFKSDDSLKTGRDGGSGGGASGSVSAGAGGSGTTDQGYAGGAGGYNGTNGGGGGGGGAGGVGSDGSGANGGDGGPGVSNSITGIATLYAAGGGGGAWATQAGVLGAGGSKLGGDGGMAVESLGRDAVQNTGSGGGGGADVRPGGGMGADGVVIISYEYDDIEHAWIEPNIESANVWQSFSLDIANIDADFLEALQSLDIQIVNVDSETTYYLDEVITLATVYVWVGETKLKVAAHPARFKEIFSLTRLKTLLWEGKRPRLTFTGQRPQLGFSGERPKARFTGWRTD